MRPQVVITNAGRVARRAAAGLTPIAVALVLLSSAATGCDDDGVAAGPPAPLKATPAQDPGATAAAAAAPTFPAAALLRGLAPTLFTEVTGAVGLEENPARYPDGTYMTPEITPGGVALFDSDNDGLLDILVVRHPPPGPYPQAFQAAALNRLYRQRPDGTFAEVPSAAGLAGRGYHHGVAIGDVNNDGFPEVYVCNYGGPDSFFLNNADGTFADATAAAGFPTAPNPANWSSTAAFVDYDADGFLDLAVAHFATFDPRKVCQVSTDPSDRDYCGPHVFPGQLMTLYRNRGDGTFVDVTTAAGIDAPGRGWGMIAADLTGDGLADILQANDEEPNQLWVQQPGGGFLDEAVLRGCAFNAAGSVEANMGVAVGDVLGHGAQDVFITHITSETNTLFRNAGDGTFTDATAGAGMAAIDRPFTGWGCGFLDFDNDGHLDLAIANGRVAKGPARAEAAVGPFWNRYAEPNLLFRGDGTGRFADVSARGGAFTHRLEVHRALAFADLRNRGAVDMVSVNVDNTVRVFRNDAAAAVPGHWLQVLPMTGKREALGAEVRLTAGGRTRAAFCLRAYSYLSSNDPRVHFGLGSTDKADAIEVRWPSGTPRREQFGGEGIDRLLVLRQGSGKAL